MQSDSKLGGIGTGVIGTVNTEKKTTSFSVNGKLKQDDEWLKSLQENLIKSKELRNQIVTMLDNFESRLKTLDENVIPLHNKTALLQKRQTNLAKVLKTIDAMQQFYGRATELENAIREGSASIDRESYIEKMDQMADAIAFFSKHSTYQQQLESMKLTFESGCVTLEKEFRNVVQADSIPADPAQVVECLDQDYEVIPARLKEIVTLRDSKRISQLAKWLLNRNPNGSLVQNYVSIRGENMLRTLAQVFQLSERSVKHQSVMTTKASSISLKQALKRATGRSSERFGRDWRTSDESVSSIILGFGSLLALIQIETEVMSTTIGDLSTEAQIQRVMFVQSLKTTIERSVKIFDALDCSLIPILPLLKHINMHYNQLTSLSSNVMGDSSYEDFVLKVRTRCCHLLDDFLDRLTNDTNKFVPPDGNVHHVTSNTLSFLSSLMEYRQTVAQLLMLSSSNSNSTYLLPRLFARILSALGLNLKNKADNYGTDETLSAVFLLNNNNYIHHVLQNDGMFVVVCEHNTEVQSFYKSEINAYKEKYLQSWNRVFSPLLHDTGNPIEDKQGFRSALIMFNNEFEKVIATQKGYCISDVKVAQNVKERIKKLVVEPYTEFYTRLTHSAFSKNLEKYVKFTPDSLEIVIDRLFDVSG
uniref:Exocyst complex component 7 n=1 Tax=Syphacia muris TaxID=451379 RepID=A0A0N5A934_9BILA